MPNITITDTTNSVKFDLGDYSTGLGFSKALRHKFTIDRVILRPYWIEYMTADKQTYTLHYTTNSYNALIVDSVNGVAPTSLADLYIKLEVLLA